MIVLLRALAALVFVVIVATSAGTAGAVAHVSRGASAMAKTPKPKAAPPLKGTLEERSGVYSLRIRIGGERTRFRIGLVSEMSKARALMAFSYIFSFSPSFKGKRSLRLGCKASKIWP